MTSQEPTEEETHPVAQSEDRRTVQRGLIVLFVAAFVAVIASAAFWFL
jgi:hypothetical protein